MSPLKDLPQKCIVSNEDDIKNISGYNFFQLPFWAKIFYRCNNQEREISLNPKDLKCEQFFIPKLFNWLTFYSNYGLFEIQMWLQQFSALILAKILWKGH